MNPSLPSGFTPGRSTVSAERSGLVRPSCSFEITRHSHSMQRDPVLQPSESSESLTLDWTQPTLSSPSPSVPLDSTGTEPLPRLKTIAPSPNSTVSLEIPSPSESGLESLPRALKPTITASMTSASVTLESRPVAVSAKAQPRGSRPVAVPVAPLSPPPSRATITVQPFSVQQEILKEPSLPRVKQAQLSNHRHGNNPHFALGILQDIATIVEEWQMDLEEIQSQIQGVYLEGPIIDGWLEAEATLDGQVQGYRLCGLDEQGRMWVRPCPPDQLPSVSIAIARYQHLRQITAQKQAVEMRLKQLGEALAMVRSRL